jgi:predicted RNA-binding Zn-ribbon protein involved in translation (DUF1610 family)
MPGANNGTGQPSFFRCSRCRKRHGTNEYFGQRGTWELGGKLRVDLTGRSKPHGGSARGVRGSMLAREYVCRDCGHRGWSKHMDLEILAPRQNVQS